MNTANITSHMQKNITKPSDIFQKWTKQKIPAWECYILC